ncbi:MAG: tyrosine-type recombinase/integrase [Microbacterium sp.]|uniref:tyrosine-type recombinase/integrase n=1 Tax=Microbacterium sp. TaxID=51671 RepID=UPI0025CD43CE|nr:tyrosine-type recombinase/integrase [Microbacterium sp.]MBQ9917436.1 tyrosine-type recombinase/integrase [Microbacterium sp.]
MASVTPRRSKATNKLSWRVQFRIDGQMHQESFPDEGQGKGVAAHEFGALVDRVGGRAALTVLRARNAAPAGMPSLREFLDSYLDPESGLLSGITPGTRDGYRRAANRSFLNILGDHPLDAITKTDVARWVAWQEKQPSTHRAGELVAAKTIKNYHGILSAALATAVREGLIEANPAYKTKLTEGAKKEAVFLTPEEFQTILHLTPEYYRPLIHFLGGTGARWGEATAVTWNDINYVSDPPTVRINKAWKKGPTAARVLGVTKSKAGRRSVSLYPDLVEALGPRGAGDRLVFQGKLSGQALWYRRFRASTWLPTIRRAQDEALCAAAGLTPLRQNPTIHDLRHSHASWLIAAGVPLPYIQARLGHEKITTTVGVYGHLVPDAHAKMADAIGHVLSFSRREPHALEEGPSVLGDELDEVVYDSEDEDGVYAPDSAA